MKNRNALFSLTLLILPLIDIFFNKFDYKTQDLINISLKPFQQGHILGTDYLGRDLLARVSQGLMISLLITLAVCLICIFFGFLIGFIMAYYSKILDKIFMFIIQTLISVPSLIITLFIIFFVGDSIYLLIFSLSLNRTLKIALLVRNETLKIKSQNYVKVAKIMGASDRYILIRHIFPNIYDIVITRVIITIPSIIFSESFLSFIGVGIKLPVASLGNLVSSGIISIAINPIEFILPSLMLILINLSVGAYRNVRN